jgi:hypothetical protein
MLPFLALVMTFPVLQVSGVLCPDPSVAKVNGVHFFLGENAENNFLYIKSSQFQAISSKEESALYSELISVTQRFCSQAQLCLSGEGPVCNAFSNMADARRRLVDGSGGYTTPASSSRVLRSIEGMDWLRLTPEGPETHSLLLFGLYHVPVKAERRNNNTITDREFDEALLYDVIASLETFGIGIEKLSIPERVTFMQLVKELRELVRLEFSGPLKDRNEHETDEDSDSPREQNPDVHVTQTSADTKTRLLGSSPSLPSYVYFYVWLLIFACLITFEHITETLIWQCFIADQTF